MESSSACLGSHSTDIANSTSKDKISHSTEKKLDDKVIGELQRLCESGDIEGLTQKLTIYPNIASESDLPLLNIAAKQGNTKVLEILMEHGIFPKEGNPNTSSAIIAYENNHNEIVKILLD